jgi:Bacterial Ig-like domain (group 3)
LTDRSLGREVIGCLRHPLMNGWPRLAAILVLLMVCGVPLARATATTTTLSLSSSSVATGTVVTFTAAVSNGSAVTAGSVNFCDMTTATYCLNSALLGSVQLTSAGTAVMKFVPGIGTHSYTAVFVATTANEASTSSAQPLTVTGLYPTTAAISSSGFTGNYTLTGTVVGTGSPTLSPTGIVSFLDTSNSNAVLGTATLGASTFGQAFASQVTYGTGSGAYGVAAGDFSYRQRHTFGHVHTDRHYRLQQRHWYGHIDGGQSHSDDHVDNSNGDHQWRSAERHPVKCHSIGRWRIRLQCDRQGVRLATLLLTMAPLFSACSVFMEVLTFA